MVLATIHARVSQKTDSHGIKTIGIHDLVEEAPRLTRLCGKKSGHDWFILQPIEAVREIFSKADQRPIQATEAPLMGMGNGQFVLVLKS